MSVKKLYQKVFATAMAAAFGICTALSIMPMPAAHANILTGILASGVQYVQLNKQLNYYNDEGRDEYFQELKKKYGVNDDEYLNNRLSGIMSSLTTAIATVDSSINDKPYNYFINPDTSFNAFCSLGHNMSVNTGMFTLLNNDDEIAVVLGHEMGHGQRDHVIEGFKSSIPYELIAQIYAESKGGNSTAAAIFANYATATKVTKPQEWEADNLAFDYIIHSNYNPGACAAVWQRVIEKMGDNSQNFVGEIFSPSDHPSNEERRDNYLNRLYEFSGQKVIVENGIVKVNGQTFLTPAAIDSMSSAERACFVAGNLAAAYHNGQATANAYVSDSGTVMLGAQPILTPVDGDQSANEIADRLNSIK